MNDWNIRETKRLFAVAAEKSACGEGLNAAFRVIARESGRTAGSVRNYYYAQLKTFAMLPEIARSLGIETSQPIKKDFVPFTQAEADELVATVLTEKARGKSVRAVIARLSQGDPKAALRLQNKYRSLVSAHPDRVRKIISRLRSDGLTYFDPYLKRVVTPDSDDSSNLAVIADLISALPAADRLRVVRLLTENAD